MSMPSFDEWVEYCFTRARDDFGGRDDDADPESIEAGFVRLERFSLAPPLLAAYMTRLLAAPAPLLDRFSDEQLAGGVWHIFGCGGCVLTRIQSPSVPLADQLGCYRSIPTIYTDLFDKVCGRRGHDPLSDYSNSIPIDMAVYMIWDMDGGIGRPAMFPEGQPTELVEAVWDVAASILQRCHTSACLKSALHGLGHLALYHRDRVAAMVDSFLSCRAIPDWLRSYALLAKESNVQ